jgi:membrane protease YdiL (CAAX protease family)
VLFGVLIAIGVTLLYQTGASMLIGGLEDEANRAAVRLGLGAMQLLLMLAPTVLLARLQTLPPGELFRFRPAPASVFVMLVLGIIALWPLLQVYLLAQNLLLPSDIAEAFRMRQQGVESLYGRFLGSNGVWAFTVSVVLGGVIPGISEEMLFRGLAQRSFERRLRPWAAITLAAILFGAVHFQPMTFVPLVLLGAYFGFVTRAVGSILPAIAGHTFFNAVGILGLSTLAGAGRRAVEPSEQDLLTLLPVTLVAFVIFVTVLAWFRRYRTQMSHDHENEPIEINDSIDE